MFFQFGSMLSATETFAVSVIAISLSALLLLISSFTPFLCLVSSSSRWILPDPVAIIYCNPCKNFKWLMLENSTNRSTSVDDEMSFIICISILFFSSRSFVLLSVTSFLLSLSVCLTCVNCSSKYFTLSDKELESNCYSFI